MTAPTRLSIYNDALLLCGERALSALTENVEPRYLLDQVWNQDGVKFCLEKSFWKFAMRTVRIDYDTAITPDFGYARAFTKPSDWCLTAALCADEYFRVPITRYEDEADNWYADEDEIYVRYVSTDDNYGMSYARWPRIFTEYVAAHFATKIMLKVTNDDDRLNRTIKIGQQLLRDAKNNNLLAEPVRFAAQGGWTKARTRWGSNNNDRGNNGSLIG